MEIQLHTDTCIHEQWHKHRLVILQIQYKGKGGLLRYHNNIECVAVENNCNAETNTAVMKCLLSNLIILLWLHHIGQLFQDYR